MGEMGNKAETPRSVGQAKGLGTTGQDGKEYYGSGQVARKLRVPRRTVTDRARKGRIPGVAGLCHGERAHYRYRRSVIDRIAEGSWPPVKGSLKEGILQIELSGLASQPLRITPCPGELPEVSAPELHLPGGVTLPGWYLPRIASPAELLMGLQRHLWD